MQNVFNFLFSVDYLPGAILNSVAIIVLEYCVLKKPDKHFPEGLEFQLYKRRFSLYDDLYFIYCVNFKDGCYINIKKNKTKIKKLNSFVQKTYLQNLNFKYILSNQLQKKLRAFLKNPTSHSFNIVQTQISLDYINICKIFKISIYEPTLFSKLRILSIFYFLLGMFSVLFSFISIVFSSGYFLVVSIGFSIWAYIIYFSCLKCDF